MSLLQLVTPILDVAKTLDLAAPDVAEKTLETLLPFHGGAMKDVLEALRVGVRDGSICNRGEEPVRYSRVAKAADAKGFSIDAVLMSGVGPRHRHPNGEIDLCFRWDGEPKFDGRDPGWVVYRADSTHAPTVTGGTMVILYFLPEGAIEWVKA